MLSSFRSCWEEHCLQTSSLFAGLAVENWQCAREERATCRSISTRTLLCYPPPHLLNQAAPPRPALFDSRFVKHWQNDAWRQFFLVVWLQILRHVCTKAFVKFHLTHAIAILCIVNAAYCLILYLLGRKQQKNSSLSLNKEFLKAAKVISSTISAILAPSANKMDHLQLIRIQTSRVPAGVNTVPVVRQCCCCKKKKKNLQPVEMVGAGTTKGQED